jgi:hypothetical protein
MSKEELVEMIEATITTNGRKEITKDALICALVAIVESM